ncbi:MAG: hypothetical protein ACSLFH_01735 [Desulfuromonadales bacterium]
MTDYATAIGRLSRTPVTVLIVTLDWCANTFGVAPCTATGAPCYNTFHTCKDQPNYNRTTREYQFSSADAPLPFPGPRPYLLRERPLATEIKDKISITGRVTFDLADEPDGDVGIDPYLDQRATVPQTSYWRKLIARNPNYIGRPARLLRGVIGMALEDFDEDWSGNLENIAIARGVAKVEVVDPLKSLADVTVPPKVSVKLAADTQSGGDSISLDKVEGLPSSGYIKLDDEVIGYTGLNTTTRQLTGCSRGALGTTADTHSGGAKVTLACYYPPTNPWNLLLAMLTNSSDITVSNPPGAGIDASRIDSSNFAAWRDLVPDVAYSALITDSTKLDKLFWEVVSLLDAHCWYSEGQQITIRRNMADAPGTGHAHWTDAANVVIGTPNVDLNPESRVNQVVLRWDLDPLGNASEEENYNRIDVAVNGETSGVNSYNKPAEKELLCRWLRSSWAPYLQEELMDDYVRALTARQLFRRADSMALIDLDVEIKDGAVRTGQRVKYTTDELLLPDGSPLDAALFEVTKRQHKGARLAYRLLRQPVANTAFFTGSDHPDYSDASEAEREYGFFSATDGTLPDGSPGQTFY